MRRLLVALALLGMTTCRARLPPATSGPAAASEVASAVTQAEPEPPVPTLPLVPLETAGAVSSGAVALACLEGRTIAFVADADDRAVVALDVDTGARLSTTPLGARPSALLVAPGGRIVALGADDGRVRVLTMSALDAPLVQERAIDVPAEPVSASLGSRGDTVLVASRWGHALSVVPLSGDAPVQVVDLPRDPGAVVASSDGRRALVAHVVGSRASVVDLEQRTVRLISLDRTETRTRSFMPMAKSVPPAAIQVATLHADQLFALARVRDDRVVAPDVFVDPGASSVSSGYGNAGAAAVTPALAELDADAGRVAATQRAAVPLSRCMLPRGVALDAASAQLLVACAGTDEVTFLRLEAQVRLRTAVRVAKGPIGIAFDPAARRAVVWSALDRVVSVLAVDGKARVASTIDVPRSTPPPTDDAQRGRALFHAAFDRRVASDGRACASCHPDGRDDALTWSSPGGRRQTPMLLQRLDGTAPFGWDGTAADVGRHLAQTTARLGGTGLGPGDVADLTAYLATLRAPASPLREDEALAARGRDVFRSREVECASCHSGKTATDGDRHDVTSRSAGDRPRAFDTPSLRFVSRSAPYFHDGRYATLADLLTGSDGTMGHTSQLAPADRAALEAYLRTL
jgi:DNA-binding beta-propeller fold protein YncE